MEEKKTQEGGSEKTFTQTELDAIIGDRLARERQKYGDYDSLKAKAAEYDKAQEASKSELQKATEKAGALQKELDALKAANSTREVREKIAKEMEVPVELLTASTEEECKKQARSLSPTQSRSGRTVIYHARRRYRQCVALSRRAGDIAERFGDGEGSESVQG